MDELTHSNGRRSVDRGQGRQSGKSEDLDLGAIVRLVSQYKLLLLFLILSAVLTSTIEHANYPTYRARATLSIQGAENNLSQAVSAKLSGISAGPGEALLHDVPEKYFQLLQSFEFSLRVAHELKSMPEFKVIRPELLMRKGRLESGIRWFKRKIFRQESQEKLEDLPDESLGAILGGMSNFGKNGTDGISVNVTTSDPGLTLLITNVLAETGAKFITENELRELDEGERYLKIRLSESEKEIRDTDASIVEFKRNHQIFNMESGQGESSVRSMGLKKELEDVEIEYRQNQKIIESLTKDLKAEEQRIMTSNAPLDVQKQLINSKPKYGFARKISDLRRQNKYLAFRRSTIQKVLGEVLRSQDPHVEQKVFDLRKKVELEYTLFHELKREQFQLEMQRIFVKNRVRLFEKAHPFDVHRSMSLQKKLLVSVLAAFFLGVFGAYVWEMLVPRVKRRTDLSDLNTIYLGSVPDITKLAIHHKHLVRASFNTKDKQHRSGICRFDIDTQASLAFKHLRTRILGFVPKPGETHEGRILSIHSAHLGEGKSFITANLAACVAHLRRKTLIIDCDLKRGTASSYFEVPATHGLSEVLTGKEKFGVVTKQSVLPYLDLVPSGSFSHESTELIAGPKFTELLQDLRSIYDFIILDTPPVTLVPDSVLVAKHSDLVILVARANRTSREAYASAMDELLDVNITRVYSVLNGAQRMQDHLYAVPERSLQGKEQVAVTRGPLA